MDQLDHEREAPAEARRGDVTVGFALLHAELPDAKFPDRAVGGSQMKPPLFDLGKIQQHPSRQPIATPDQPSEIFEQLIVGKLAEIFHSSRITC